MGRHWDIFCAVVDNYGDIGVTWRLARQLAAEHGIAVRLWVDDLSALARLCPETDVYATEQALQGVDIRHWLAESAPSEPGAVVIEAFACQLPARFETAMLVCAQPPLWLNLEYLSAEDWVVGCHGLPSPQTNGLRKTFFFPGFVDGTGGLLREADLLERREAFQADQLAQSAFFAGIAAPWLKQARRISLFTYENPRLGSWLDALVTDVQITQLLVPMGRVCINLQSWLGVSELREKDSFQRGNLHIHLLPFMPQDDYDRLLWCCALNLVRGEDSFVRAQWAGRPLLWHIYEQEEGAHWLKLEAFLALYQQALPAPAQAALKAFWYAWNAQEDLAGPWVQVQQQWDALQNHAESWCNQQAARPDLAARLALL